MTARNFHEPADPPVGTAVLVNRHRFDLLAAMAKTTEANATHEFCIWAGTTYATPLQPVSS